MKLWNFDSYSERTLFKLLFITYTFLGWAIIIPQLVLHFGITSTLFCGGNNVKLSILRHGNNRKL